ncbi:MULTISPECIES: hypothetical protein [unclassified Vibrio]|uniref:hypothetical protein n=1 Tax=unclassified Vibrio TaxID=2614977 RepID=UPI0027CD367E|nr:MULTISPECIES: hypothetical protein [unclassified Vibrio]MDQ2108591.1 hypothetical protein [Vibrio sp. 2017_1457_15]MDQ2161730.1 hypothetical protein [Vibrio sp. 2017_1457_13]
MNVALKWIKALGLAGLLITILFQGLQLKASQAKQATLNEQLNKAKADNQSNLITIGILKGEAEQTNKLLVQRKRQQIQAEEKLNADMATLKAQLANIDCHIPDAVTRRLREPY